MIRLLNGVSLPMRSLLSASIWSMTAEVVSRGLLFLAFLVVARLLSTEDYGEFGLIRTTVMTFSTIGGIGLGLTANRYLAEFKDSDPHKCAELVGSSYLIAFVSGAIVGAAVFLGAQPLASRLLGHPELYSSLRIAGVLILLSSINGAQIGILQGFEAFRSMTLGNLVQGAVALIALIVGAHVRGVDGALYGLLAYSITGVAIAAQLIRRELAAHGIARISWGVRSSLPIFFHFSIPVALMGIVIAPFKWMSEAILGARAGFEHLGVFHAAMLITSILATAAATLNAPLLSANSRKDPVASPLLSYLNLYGGWFAFLILAAPLIIAPNLPGLLLGAKYDTGQFRIVILLLLLYSALMLYYQGVMRMIARHGSMWVTLNTNIAEGLTLFLAFLALQRYGAVGLGMAYVASYAVRIALSVPILIARDLVPRGLLFERRFLASLVVVLGVTAFQIGRLS